MSLVTILQDDDVSTVTDLALDREAGSTTTPVELHIWNDQGNSDGQDITNLLLIDGTESLTEADVYLRQGLPPQDEHWREIRIVGYTNTGDTSWSIASTDWFTLGAHRAFSIASLPANCAVHVEVRERIPSTALAIDWRAALLVFGFEFAVPAHSAVSAALRGVVSGVGNAGRSALLRGGEVTASGSPDDEVHAAAALWMYRGRYVAEVATDHALNQNDGAAAALTAGQAYLALVTGGPTGKVITKGLRAASPSRPALPAWHVMIAVVRVDYQAGASVIETADITDDPGFNRYEAIDGGGLNLWIYPGNSLGGESERRSNTVQVVPLEASETNSVWQLSIGLFEVTTDGEPPDAGATPYFEVDTDADSITAIRDRRTFIGGEVVITLAGATPGSPGTVASQLCGYTELVIEDVILRISNTSGTAGFTKADLLINGTTVYTSSGTDDQRPRVAFDASVLYDRGRVHELVTVRANDLLTFATVAHPSTASPTSVELTLICRRP